MLSLEQHEFFERAGYVRLPRAFADAEAMAAFVWSRLSELHGIKRDDRTTWSADAPWVGLNRFKDHPLFQSISSEAVCSAIDDLLGSGAWVKPKTWGGFLIKFPDGQSEAWTIPPDAYWHVDSHFSYEPGTRFGVRVFSLLSEVEPHGGGTLAVAGSHRLVERFVRSMPPEQRREAFAVLRRRFNTSDPWLSRLTTSDADMAGRVEFFMARPSVVGGVAVRVIELCGGPGDVILMHPWLLHAASPNASDRPRFMLAKDIVAQPTHARAQRAAATAIG